MPSAPNKLVASVGSSQAITLSWQPQQLTGDTVGYKIFRNATLLDHTSQSYYHDSSLTIGTAYTYNIVSFNGSGTVASGTDFVTISIPTPVISSVGGEIFIKGDPTNVLAAPVGTLALRRDGGSSTTLYVKETGGSTSAGWVAK